MSDERTLSEGRQPGAERAELDELRAELELANAERRALTARVNEHDDLLRRVLVRLAKLERRPSGSADGAAQAGT